MSKSSEDVDKHAEDLLSKTQSEPVERRGREACRTTRAEHGVEIVRADLEALLNFLLPFAHEMLTKRGEFYPFGATVDAEGQMVMCGAYTGSEHPPSNEVMAHLAEGIRAGVREGSIRASGICSNAQVSSVSGGIQDAITLDLESPAECCRLVVPYRKRLFRGYQFDTIKRIAITPSIFVT